MPFWVRNHRRCLHLIKTGELAITYFQIWYSHVVISFFTTGVCHNITSFSKTHMPSYHLQNSKAAGLEEGKGMCTEKPSQETDCILQNLKFLIWSEGYRVYWEVLKCDSTWNTLRYLPGYGWDNPGGDYNIKIALQNP